MAKRSGYRGFYGTMTQGTNVALIIALRPQQTGYNERLEAARARTYERVLALDEAGKGAEAERLEDWMRSLKTTGASREW